MGKTQELQNQLSSPRATDETGVRCGRLQPHVEFEYLKYGWYDWNCKVFPVK